MRSTFVVSHRDENFLALNFSQTTVFLEGKKKEEYNTGDSHVVTHQSTNPA